MNAKHRLFGIVLFLFLLISGLGSLFFFFIREHRKGADFAEALETYRRGDIPAAKTKFEAIVRNDRNHENAYLQLARIARDSGNWQEEALCWHCAGVLNPLAAEYRRNRKNALAMERNFPALRKLLLEEADPDQERSDEDDCHLLVAMLHCGEAAEFREYRSRLEKKKPEFFRTEYGRLIRCLEAETADSALREELASLGKSRNPVVAFESLLRLALWQGNAVPASPDEAEKTLRDAVRVNAFAGLPYLANFYIDRGRFDRAADCCSRNFERFHRPASAIKLAELHLLTGEAEKIAALLPRFGGGDRAALITGCYLESLLAFSRRDDRTLNRSFAQLRDTVRTPVGALVGLYDAVSRGDAAAMESAWYRFRLMPEFHDLPERAGTLILSGIHRLIAADRKNSALRLLNLSGVDFLKDLGLTRFLVIEKLRLGQLRPHEARRALERYPDDRFLLSAAVESACREGDFSEAIRLADAALRHDPPDPCGIRNFRILALAGTGRVDDAAAELCDPPAAAEVNPGVLFAVCAPIRENRRIDLLEKICAALRRGDSALLPYAEGELLLLKGRTEEALECFTRLRSRSPELLFRTARILGEHDRIVPARAFYRQLLELPETPPRLRAFASANLAELHAAAGSAAEALQSAEDAWKLMPDHPALQYCYAEKLLKTGGHAAMLRVIAPVPYHERPDFPLRRLWIAAAEAEILRLERSGEKAAARQLCRTLLLVKPDSAVGRELLLRLFPAERENPS